MPDSNVSILDIITIIIKYSKLTKLKFSTAWMSKGSFKLIHDNTMAMKTGKRNKYILLDIEPVKEGKVCWRVKVCYYINALYLKPLQYVYLDDQPAKWMVYVGNKSKESIQ